MQDDGARGGQPGPAFALRNRLLALRRRAGDIPPGGITLYSLDRAEEFARLVPGQRARS
jgi:hypothetical protein